MPQSIQYTSTPGFVGTDTITYAVVNSQGAQSNAATITINVTASTSESANLTQVPPAASITDSTGAVWTLVADPTKGNQIARNGVVDTITNQVTLLAYVNHVLYQEAYTLWWSWTNNAWVQTDSPLPAPPPVLQNQSSTAQTAVNDLVYPQATGAFTSIQIVSGPSHGTATPSAAYITYKSNAAYTGSDSFTYTVTNASGAVSNVATCSLTVQTAVVAGQRNWLLGWFGEGSTNPKTTFGVAPEFSYDVSYEDPHFGSFAILYNGINGVFGYPTILSVALDNGALEAPPIDYAGAAAGNYNANYTAVANGVKNSGHGDSIYAVRIDPEFNFHMDQMSGATYIAAWNNCARIWKQIMPNVKTIWNPSMTADSRADCIAYFPGTQYCDLVGWDFYTETTYNLPFNKALGAADGSQVGTLNWALKQNLGGLPWCFPEWGDQFQNYNNDSSQLIATMQWMDSQPNFVMAGWWDGGGAGAVMTATGQSAFNSMLKGRPYSGSYWQPLKPIPNLPGLSS